MLKKEATPAAAQSSSEYVFIFKYNELFTPAQMAESDLGDISVLKRLVASAMNKRLRVREIPDLLDLGQQGPARGASMLGGAEAVPTAAGAQVQHPTRYIAFFLDEK